MFGLLGHWVSRAWPLVLVGWLALLVVTQLAAPPLQDIVQDKEFAFLPPQAPSRRSEDVFQKAFPDDRSASNVVLVVHRRGSEVGHLGQDKKFVEEVLQTSLMQIVDAEGGLASDDSLADWPDFSNKSARPPNPGQRSIVARIRTPSDLGTGALLVSPDHQVLLVALELTTDFLANQNWLTITKIEDLVQKLKSEGRVPAGLDIAVTGSAVIGRDHNRAQLESARATELLTVLLVIGLLLLIYRAPLLAMIPLVTVYLAVQVSLNLLAILAGAGYLTLFQGIQIYITILAYGAGVDYCLFLTARYKEELDQGKAPADAVASALQNAGAALTASAFTVIGGIGMMMFAQFGKFREAGFAIPFTLCLVLCATLTFSPSLLRLAGRRAFWPQRPKKGLGCATPTSATGFFGRFRQAGGFQQGWEKTGQILLRRPGLVWLVTVGLMLPFAIAGGLFYNRLSYDLIGDLPADSPSVVGTRVLQEHFPAGLIGPTKILIVNPRVDFSSSQGRGIVEEVTSRLQDQQEELGLADLRSLTEPLGITEAAKNAFVDFGLSERFRRQIVERAALKYYVTDLGESTKTGTRLDLVLNHGPFSEGSVVHLDKVERAIRASLPVELRDDSQLYCAGPTPSIRDVQAVMKQDRVRIEMLVLASVFLILLLLLRQPVVSLYLLVSVVFSYYATLGASFVVFWLLDPHGFAGIDWKVAIFLFTILIAVGEDYNIFLMARIHEEQRRRGPVRGITEALCRTGPIISSCGIIMAGTFASLLAGSLIEMKQLGFALAFGILLDTFVVRPILVPAFLILQQRGGLVPTGWRRRTMAELVESRNSTASLQIKK